MCHLPKNTQHLCYQGIAAFLGTIPYLHTQPSMVAYCSPQIAELNVARQNCPSSTFCVALGTSLNSSDFKISHL